MNDENCRNLTEGEYLKMQYTWGLGIRDQVEYGGCLGSEYEPGETDHIPVPPNCAIAVHTHITRNANGERVWARTVPSANDVVASISKKNAAMRTSVIALEDGVLTLIKPEGYHQDERNQFNTTFVLLQADGVLKRMTHNVTERLKVLTEEKGQALVSQFFKNWKAHITTKYRIPTVFTKWEDPIEVCNW